MNLSYKPYAVLSCILMLFSFAMAHMFTTLEGPRKRQAPVSQEVKMKPAEAAPVRDVLAEPIVRDPEKLAQALARPMPDPNADTVNIITPNPAKSGDTDRGNITVLSQQERASRTASRATPLEVRYDEVVMNPKPVLVIEGEGNWEHQLSDVRVNRELLEKTAKDLGLKAIGHPVMAFLETRPASYHFEFMLPIAAIPDPEPKLPKGISYSLSPAGIAYRFTHSGPYNGIERTYGTISTFVSSKQVEVKDVYLEEYPTNLNHGEDSSDSVNIYILPRNSVSRRPTL
ncbi:MAG: GyrI-like domain-containing protein [Methylobacteriaceae bacterium]|jgi:effector-binding domain-containing protein|nr:GyrI-like domain-containing protein [Methylobacteriaceae bacterium]